jgi:hypothetical protein
MKETYSDTNATDKSSDVHDSKFARSSRSGDE